jgi:hypothetical protein
LNLKPSSCHLEMLTRHTSAAYMSAVDINLLGSRQRFQERQYRCI